MNKHKLVSTLVLAFFLFSILPIGPALSTTDQQVAEVFRNYLLRHVSFKNEPLFADVYNDDEKLVAKVLAEANKDIEEIFGVKDYYPETVTVSIGGKTRTLKVNADQLRYRRIVVYGTPQDVNYLEPGRSDLEGGYHRFLGYDRDGTLITNPSFPATTGPKVFNPNIMVHHLSTSAKYLADRMISTEDNIKYTMSPGHRGVAIAKTIKRNSFSYREITDKGLTFKDQPLSDYLSRHIAFSAVLINFWETYLGRDYFNNYGIGVPEVKDAHYFVALGGFTIGNIAFALNQWAASLDQGYTNKDPEKGTLHRDVHIVTPPTRHTWGTGYAFFEDKDNVYVYRTILIAPFMELNPDLPDLYTKSLTADTETTEPGQRYTGQVVFGLKDYDKPVRAKLTLTHNKQGISGINDEIIELQPDEEITFDFEFTGQNGSSYLYARIDPIESEDLDSSNNDKELRLDQEVNLTDLPDFYTKHLTANTTSIDQGKKYVGTVIYGLKGCEGPVQARLTLTHNGYSVSGIDGQKLTFNPGEERTFTFNFTGQNGPSHLFARIDPVTGPDKDPANNAKKLDIPQIERAVPSLNARLTLQAVTQDKADKRPLGEAKWTDWVTATLKPSAVVPPKGNLDSWKITSAKITYPEKHHKFTFGTPYQPIRTTTKNMKISGNGHTASLEFQQDWSMDGFPVYSILEKKQMTTDKPKKYPVKVEYTIQYQYSWTECETTCTTNEEGETTCTTTSRTKRRTASKSGTETTQLLVTGTGVDSKAH